MPVQGVDNHRLHARSSDCRNLAQLGKLSEQPLQLMVYVMGHELVVGGSMGMSWGRHSSGDASAPPSFSAARCWQWPKPAGLLGLLASPGRTPFASWPRWTGACARPGTGDAYLGARRREEGAGALGGRLDIVKATRVVLSVRGQRDVRFGGEPFSSTAHCARLPMGRHAVVAVKTIINALAR